MKIIVEWLVVVAVVNVQPFAKLRSHNPYLVTSTVEEREKKSVQIDDTLILGQKP